MKKMNKEEWEKFWEWLLKKAEKLEIDFLIEYWLEDQMDEYKNKKEKEEVFKDYLIKEAKKDFDIYWWIQKWIEDKWDEYNEK